MTIASSITKQQYNCNGSVKAFVFTFPVFESSDIKIILLNKTTGTETTLTETTDYVVTAPNNDFSSGGTVTTVQAYSADYSITLKREMEFTQETDYAEGDSFPADSHERALDKQTMISQQINEGVGRCLTFPETEGNTNTKLPDISLRKGKVFSFDPTTGEPVATLPLEEAQTAQEYAAAAHQSALDAETAKTGAETARTGAQTAKTGAETAQAAAEAAAANCTNASNLTSGTLPDARLSANVPIMTGGKLPAVDGSQLTNLPSSSELKVKAATIDNVTVSTALNAGDIIDGVTLTNGDLILVKNQTMAAENGIYVVSDTPARWTSFDSDLEIRRKKILVQQGSINAGILFENTNISEITVGTTALTFAPDKLLENVFINVVTADSMASVQAKMNALPKNLNGNSLNIPYTAGTHTYNGTGLIISGFYNGTINIYGAGTASTTINATAMGAGTSYSLFYFNNCQCYCAIYNMTITESGTSSQNAITANLVMYLSVAYITFTGNNVSYSSSAIQGNTAQINTYGCSISNYSFAINAQPLSKIYCNVLSGSGNSYALYAAGGHIVGYSPNISISAVTGSGTTAGGIVSITA